MSSEKLSLNQQETKIIEKMKLFINHFGKYEDIHTDFIGKIIKSNKPEIGYKDFLDGLINTLDKAKETLDDKVKMRSTGNMLNKVISVSEDLTYILNQISTHEKDRKQAKKIRLLCKLKKFITKYNMTLKDFQYQHVNIRKTKKMYTKNEFNIDDYNSQHKISRIDIYILGYYELITLYKNNDIKKDFKIKAIRLIERNFGYSLQGNKLKVFLTSISLENTSLSLSESDKQLQKKNLSITLEL